MPRPARVPVGVGLLLVCEAAGTQPLPAITLAHSPPAARTTWAVPATPFVRVDTVVLGGSTQTHLVARSDGGLALALGAPPRLVLLSSEGQPEATLPLEAVPVAIAPIDRGAVLLDDRAGQTLRVSADGALRAVSAFSAAQEPGPWVALADGSAVRLAGLDARTVLQRVDARGQEFFARAVPMRVTQPTAFSDGTLVYASQRNLVRCHPDGTWRRVPSVPGVRSVVALDDGGLALATDDGVYFVRGDGTPGARVGLDASPHRIDAASDGGVVATLLGTPPRAVRIDRDGTVRWRVPLASADVSYHFDRLGAALVLSAAGSLRALAPDGSERWQLGLNTRVLLPAVVTPVGTLLVATARGDLLRLRP